MVRFRSLTRAVSALTLLGLGSGFGVAAYMSWRRRRWLAGLDLVSDPAFAFPMVRHAGSLLPLDMYKAWGELDGLTFHPDDIIVASFPKSGTTWVQEIVFLLATELDFLTAKGYTMEERVPYLEYVWPGVKALATRPRPRIMKTHLPAHMLPPEALSKARIVYIARDPRDVAVSYFHFAHMFTPSGYRGDWDDFLHRFLRSQILPYAPWDDHVRRYRRLAGTVLFLTYEELSADPTGSVQKIADFLGKPVTADEVDRIVQHCRFEEMSRNPATNYVWWDQLGLRRRDAGKTRFMRRGKVGDWRNHLSDEQAADFQLLLTSTDLHDLWSDNANR